MCVDPISLGATAIAALTSTGAAAAASVPISFVGASGALLSAGTISAATPALAASAGILGTGITATQALIGGATALGALGTYNQANAQAAVDRQNAENARLAGYANEAQSRDDARRQMATQLATLSARGFSLSSGTPLALLADSARNSELNALNIRANAANTAAGYEYKAAQAKAAVPWTIAGQLLSGASKLSALGQI